MPHLNSGLVVQVDVQNDAKRFVEIAMILKSRRRLKQQAVIAVRPQQSLHASQHALVVVHNEDEFVSACHD
jgi:hypothetical protein